MEFHKLIGTEKMHNGNRKIFLKDSVDYKIIFNPFKGYDELYIQDKCMMLMQDNKCKVFRNRPEICKKASCPIFDKNPEIQFYAENGVLKDVLRKNQE